MNYGIANRSGMASSEAVAAILSGARQAGARLLDTAWAYGEAERVLGTQAVVAGGFKVVTKTRPLKGMSLGPADAAELVAGAFHESLSRLGAERAYGLLVHHADDLLGPCGEAVWAKLQQLRSEGLVEKIGCSVYGPAELSALLDRYELDLAQIPFSIYDQRYVTSGLAARARALRVEVHLRSAFLQGVLLMSPADLPGNFDALRGRHAALRQEFEALGVTPLEGALGFCLECGEADAVIVGCEQVAQWDAIRLAAAKPLPVGAREQLGRFALEDEAYINPSRWRS